MGIFINYYQLQNGNFLYFANNTVFALVTKTVNLRQQANQTNISEQMRKYL